MIATVTATETTSSPPPEDNPPELFEEEINILYDSKCNICVWEMEWLCQREVAKNGGKKTRIKLTDIEDPNYNANDPANGHVDYSTAIRSMHAVLKDGTVLEGLSVFRVAYGLAGMGWLLAMTTWPVLTILFDLLYSIFAKYRTVITRGITFEQLLKEHEEQQQQAAATVGGKPSSTAQSKKEQ